MKQTVEVNVEGMTCGNCALSISKVLEKKGAQQITANAASGEVRFAIEEEADAGVYLDAINNLGFKVQEEVADAHAHHDHGGEKVSWQNTRLLICAILTLPLLLHMFVSWPIIHNPYFQLALTTPVFILGMLAFVPSAVRSLKNGLPNMEVLIVIGAVAAFGYSLIGLIFYPAEVHNYLFFETAASIITLVLAGNWLEQRTVRSTTSAIRELSSLQPQKARLILRDSLGKEQLVEVDTKDLKDSDQVLVAEGDSIPVDAIIIEGAGRVDEKMITGESAAQWKKIGDAVVGGTIVTEGNFKIEATAVGAKSVLQRIIRMVQDAQSTKPRLQRLADKISAVFVPVVLGIAVLTLLGNYYIGGLSFAESMLRSIAVLVISCPCAMGLATPAAVAVGLGRAAKMGILVKGGDTLEQMKHIKQIVFDKTGTLTTGELSIGDLKIFEGDEQEVKGIISTLESKSVHPIAKSVYASLSNFRSDELKEVKEEKGKGMTGIDEQGNTWRLGSAKWLGPLADLPAGYDLFLLKDDTVIAALTIVDELRADAKETIALLKARGYKTILLSGDSKAKSQQVANHLGIDEVFAEHSPEEKNEKIKALNGVVPTAMVGDGINDAPALAQATVGISLSKATQVAIQSAHIILSNNKLSSLPEALRLGIYTEQTIKQNLFWAFLYNIIAIPVAAIGLLKPTFAAGIMALSDVVLIINSVRLRWRKLS